MFVLNLKYTLSWITEESLNFETGLKKFLTDDFEELLFPFTALGN